MKRVRTNDDHHHPLPSSSSSSSLSSHLPLFDVETYASRYVAPMRVIRLVGVANALTGRSAAAAAAAELVANTYDTALYEQVCTRHKLQVDQAYMTTTPRVFIDRMARVDGATQLHQREARSEAVRQSLKEAAELLVQRGDYAGAMCKYVEMKEYSSTREQALEMYTCALKCCVWNGSYPLMKAQESRVAQVAASPYDHALLNVSRGLFELKYKNWGAAARCFCAITPVFLELGKDLMSGNDVALAGTVCALAALSRAELKRDVVGSAAFRKFLECEPVLLELVQAYIDCRYALVFELLATRIEPLLRLDMHLAEHCSAILGRIRQVAFAQFFAPFVTVRIQHMATAFALDADTLERELVTLIEGNLMDARIDSQNKILIAKHDDERVHGFERALEVTSEFARQARAYLLNMSIVERKLTLEARKSKSSKSSSSAAAASAPRGQGGDDGDDDEYFGGDIDNDNADGFDDDYGDYDYGDGGIGDGNDDDDDDDDDVYM